MTQWVRSNRDTLCGRCGVLIRKGDLLLLLRIEAGAFSLRAPKRRCSLFACAGEAIPENVADLPSEFDTAPAPKIPAHTGFLEFARSRWPGAVDR